MKEKLSSAGVCCHPIPKNEIHRILVVRPNHRLGNTILLTPLIAELERVYRGAEIDIVIEGNAAAEVFSAFPSVRHIHCLPKRGFKHPYLFLTRFFHIRQISYDLIIDPCLGSGFSRILTSLFKGQRKIGFVDSGKRSGLTHPVAISLATRHMATRAICALRAHSPVAPDQSIDFPRLDIRLSDAERTQGQLLIRGILDGAYETSPRVVIGIFANATGAKCYSHAWWDDFTKTLTTLCPHAGIVEIVPMHGRSMFGSQWPGYYSSSIRRMGAAMAGVDLMISADCGVMHLAVASGVPTVGLFAVTDAAVYGPYGAGNMPLYTQNTSAAETARAIVIAYPALRIAASERFVDQPLDVVTAASATSVSPVRLELGA